MSKFYVVKVTKVTMCLVEVGNDEDHDDAMSIAADENLDADVEIDSGPFNKDSEQYESAERHVDESYLL